MLRAVREALETYASGMGVSASVVIKEFKALPEADKFTMLAAIKDLEKKHQEHLARKERIAAGIPCGGEKCSATECKCPGRLPMPPLDQMLLPEPKPIDMEAIARAQRGQYALSRLLARQSPILGVDGRPLRRG